MQCKMAEDKGEGGGSKVQKNTNNMSNGSEEEEFSDPEGYEDDISEDGKIQYMVEYSLSFISN